MLWTRGRVSCRVDAMIAEEKTSSGGGSGGDGGCAKKVEELETVR